MSELDAIVESARSEMAAAANVREIEALRVRFLGKQGLVTIELTLAAVARFHRMSPNRSRRGNTRFCLMKPWKP